jgi:hypothetical protein
MSATAGPKEADNGGWSKSARQRSIECRSWPDLPHGAQGTVICTYRLLRGTQAASGRLDVRFSPRVRVVAWGVPESAFEPIDP